MQTITTRLASRRITTRLPSGRTLSTASIPIAGSKPRRTKRTTGKIEETPVKHDTESEKRESSYLAQLTVTESGTFQGINLAVRKGSGIVNYNCSWRQLILAMIAYLILANIYDRSRKSYHNWWDRHRQVSDYVF